MFKKKSIADDWKKHLSTKENHVVSVSELEPSLLIFLMAKSITCLELSAVF